MRTFDPSDLICDVHYVRASAFSIKDLERTLSNSVFFRLQPIRIAKHKYYIGNERGNNRNRGETYQENPDQPIIDNGGENKRQGEWSIPPAKGAD